MPLLLKQIGLTIEMINEAVSEVTGVEITVMRGVLPNHKILALPLPRKQIRAGMVDLEMIKDHHR